MSELAAISALGAASGTEAAAQVTLTRFPGEATIAAAAPAEANFTTVLGDAISSLDGKVAEADRMVAQFAIDESTPIHHVTIALEEARMAVELATQVRQRLTDGYRELMNMQL